MNDYSMTHGSDSALRSEVVQSHLRLTRRGRVVFTTLAAIPLVFAALTFALNGGMATATGASGADSLSSATITVYAGQSLWGLAEDLAPTEDTREVVAQLLKANSLDNADVRPGQQLVIPELYR